MRLQKMISNESIEKIITGLSFFIVLMIVLSDKKFLGTKIEIATMSMAVVACCIGVGLRFYILWQKE
jgi:hypothetical protein